MSLFGFHKNHESLRTDNGDLGISKEKYFHLDDGRVIKSLKELYDIIDSINHDEFIKHQINNNFGKWVREVFNDEDLHNKLLSASTKNDCKSILKEKLGITNEDVKLVEPVNKTINGTVKQELIQESNQTMISGVKNDISKKELKDVKKDVNEDVSDNDKINMEKEIFNEINYNNILAIAEKEFNQTNYEHALINYESALKIKKDDFIIKRIDFIKTEISKIEKRKKDEEFLINTETKSFASKIEAFNLKFIELKERIKNLRKAGKDVYIADIHLMPLKSKIMIAEVTKAKKDLDVIINLIMIVQKELDEVELDKIVDVRAEIEEGAKKLIVDEIKKEISA